MIERKDHGTVPFFIELQFMADPTVSEPNTALLRLLAFAVCAILFP